MPVDILAEVAAFAGGGACIAGVGELRKRGGFSKGTVSREELEKCVRFLETVPLFRNQLPKAAIPRLAASMVRRVFRSGRTLAAQGEMSSEFFVIESGEAVVLVSGEERAMLSVGDFWGDGSLIRCRASAATITAIGQVTALTLTAALFEGLGLPELLKPPKRAALYNGTQKGKIRRRSTMEQHWRRSALPPGAEDFIYERLRQELSLKEVTTAHPRLLRQLAATAQVWEVDAGCAVVNCGDFSRECFVIKSGDVEVFPEAFTGPRSADFVVAISNLRKRYASNVRRSSTGVQQRSSNSKVVRSSTDGKFITHAASLTSLDGCFGRPNRVRSETIPKGFSRWVLDEDDSNNAKAEGVLGPGAIFGEVTMFYNTRYAATFRASLDGPVQLYAISRVNFKACLYSQGPEYKEWCELLDEAPVFAPLFRGERREVARHASGYRNFKPGDTVVAPGGEAGTALYVIATGHALLRSTKAQVLSFRGAPVRVESLQSELELRRGDAFGDLTCGAEAGYSVRAGLDGMVCLCIEAEVLNSCGLSRETVESSCTMTGVSQLAKVREGYGSNGTLANDKDLSAVDPETLAPVCVLGSGSFGFVVMLKDPLTKQNYALKRMSKGLFQKSQRQHICAERDLMSMMESNFIVRLHCSWRDPQFLYLLQEAVLGGSLDELIQRDRQLFRGDDRAAMFYVACVVEALEHLHSRSVLFRDLKSENVILDDRGYAKLCDLGFARFVLGKTYTCCGTPEYMAPEVLDFKGYGFPVDWWSLGVLACELLTGQTPWEVDFGDEDYGTWTQDLRKRQNAGVPESVLSRTFRPVAARQFVVSLLQVSPKTRLGSKEGVADVRGHAWFSGATFDHSVLREQAMRAPWVPELFRPRGPAPDLRQDVPITCHEDCALIDGHEISSEMATLEEALRKCHADDACEAFCCRAAGEDEKVLVSFRSQSAAVRQPGKMIFRKRRDLFKEYADDGSDWDRTFALPAAVSVAHRARQHRRGEFW